MLQLYLKNLGFSEVKINWAIEDAVRFQNGAFSMTQRNSRSGKIPRHKVMVHAFFTATITLIIVSILFLHTIFSMTSDTLKCREFHAQLGSVRVRMRN